MFMEKSLPILLSNSMWFSSFCSFFNTSFNYWVLGLPPSSITTLTVMLAALNFVLGASIRRLWALRTQRKSKSTLISATWWVRPVLLLPVRDLSALAQRVNPVVPRLAAQRPVRVARLCGLDGSDTGHHLFFKVTHCVSVFHNSWNVSCHYMSASLFRNASYDPVKKSIIVGTIMSPQSQPTAKIAASRNKVLNLIKTSPHLLQPRLSRSCCTRRRIG